MLYRVTIVDMCRYVKMDSLIEIKFLMSVYTYPQFSFTTAATECGVFCVHVFWYISKVG